MSIFNKELKHRVRELEHEVKDLRIKYSCLVGNHEWIVAQGMSIRCKHCHKVPSTKSAPTFTTKGDE